MWSLVPRVDRFTPPGPRLDRATHPRLFDLIQRVAVATRQEMPAEVYLLNEVNAWVTERGGVMGFGSRRVMGIGLPLMQSVSVAEFEAIIAHEFGHCRRRHGRAAGPPMAAASIRRSRAS